MFLSSWWTLMVSEPARGSLIDLFKRILKISVPLQNLGENGNWLTF